MIVYGQHVTDPRAMYGVLPAPVEPSIFTSAALFIAGLLLRIIFVVAGVVVGLVALKYINMPQLAPFVGFVVGMFVFGATR